MNKLLSIIVLLMFLTSPCAKAEFIDYTDVKNNLYQRLSEKDLSVKDSIAVMSNIFDILQSEGQRTDSITTKIYRLAMKHGDYGTAYDMLNNMANIDFQDIARLDSLLEMAKGMPEHHRKQETLTFIEMARNCYYTYYADNEKRQERFDNQLRQLTVQPPKDIYQHIQMLHSICLNLAKETRGELTLTNFEQLLKLIEEVPEDYRALRNTALVQAALAYSNSDESERAIATDKKLLEVIDQMDANYSKIGRPYRSFDANRYIIYTRLLSNWEDLSPDQIEEYYEKALECANQDQRAKNTESRYHTPDIYYAMATKDYPKAYELLKEQVNQPYNSLRKTRYLKYLIISAKALGDEKTTLEASLEYNKILEQQLQARIEEKYKELQIIYETNSMREKIAANDVVAKEKESHFQHIVITICLIALGGLMILVFFLIRQYRHSERLRKTLFASNEALKSESCSLRASQRELSTARDAAQKANQFKSDFIKNMSHEISAPLNAIIEYSRLIVDCADASKKPYLDRYAELVETNGEFLTTIINDVFHLSELDSDTVKLHQKFTNIPNLICLSIQNLAPKVKKGVEIGMAPNVANIDSFTDPRRLQQILMNLIGNAAKYTSKGKITVDCKLVDEGKNLEISVTDTGIGVPGEQSEYIFERYVKLDKEAPGIGLGLTISRMLARMLGGDLKLDTRYTHGARFDLTIPHRVTI